MTLTSKTRFFELMGTANSAVLAMQAEPASRDGVEVVRAVSATCWAAGFLEALLLTDPFAARDLLPEFDSFALFLERACRARASSRAEGR